MLPNGGVWKRFATAAAGVSAIAGAIVAWREAELPVPAFAADVMAVEQKLEMAVHRLTARIEGIDRLILYRERDRVVEELDALRWRRAAEPGNADLSKLIRVKENELREIDRQLDEKYR